MKELIDTLALMSLFAFVGLTSAVPEVRASTDVNAVFYSTMTSRVIVTTGTAIRVDNWHRGVQGSIVSGRINLFFQNLDSADDIFCDTNILVSTFPTSVNQGFKYGTGVFGSEGLTTQGSLYCQCADAGGAAACVMATRQSGRT